MIECKNVSKKFLSGTEFFAVNNISFIIESGEFVAITGKSGSGKSTLMNMIGLIDTPSYGEIIIDGISSKNMSQNQLAELRNKKIGYVFQSFFLDPEYSVLENVEIPLIISNVSAKNRMLRVEECLKQVGLYDKKNIYAGKLSGGEMQRVCIARALSNDPEIILADEPCGNLDSENTEIVMKLLCDLNEKGKTIVLITHSPEEASYAQRKIVLKDGKVMEP